MMICHWCDCRATTSREAHPACYWCADPGLDDSACVTCGVDKPRPTTDPVEKAHERRLESGTLGPDDFGGSDYKE